jgi:hypothetical protein
MPAWSRVCVSAGSVGDVMRWTVARVEERLRRWWGLPDLEGHLVYLDDEPLPGLCHCARNQAHRTLV